MFRRRAFTGRAFIQPYFGELYRRRSRWVMRSKQLCVTSSAC